MVCYVEYWVMCSTSRGEDGVFYKQTSGHDRLYCFFFVVIVYSDSNTSDPAVRRRSGKLPQNFSLIGVSAGQVLLGGSGGSDSSAVGALLSLEMYLLGHAAE